MELRPETALRKAMDGTVSEVPAADFRVNDVVVLRPGARVPADGMIVSGRGSLDEANITGESMPVAKQTGALVFEATRVEIYPDALQILMPIKYLAAVRRRLMDGEHAEKDAADPSQLRLIIPVRMQLRGGRAWILGGQKSSARPDPVLVNALRAAHAMVERDTRGVIKLESAPASPYQRRLVRLAFLAPDLQRAILAGHQPLGLTLSQLIQGPIPAQWAKQVALLQSPCSAQ